MTGFKVGVSALLGGLVTLLLVFLMFKLIDSGNMDMDEQPAYKIPDFLHVERDRTENAKMTEVEKPDDPQEMPDIPEEQFEFEVPEESVNIAVKLSMDDLKLGNTNFTRDSAKIPIFVQQPRYPNKALQRRKEGYAVVKVTVNEDGSASDPIILEEYPEGMGFGRQALRVAAKLRFKPEVVDGVAVKSSATYKYKYVLGK